MNKYLVGRLLICVMIMFVASAHGASSYFYDSEERYPNALDDEVEDTDKSLSDDSLLDNMLQQGASKRSSLIQVYRRACIRRSGNCDHRSNDCCYNSSCRCNLWGSNCRCQRMGLFQKWGWTTWPAKEVLVHLLAMALLLQPLLVPRQQKQHQLSLLPQLATGPMMLSWTGCWLTE